MMEFALHPKLEADTLFVCELELCRVLLMQQRHFLWLIAVPMREDAVEWFDLSPRDQMLLASEVMQVGQSLKAMTGADKINIAALGNQVPQLHVHIVARFVEDKAWPNPVWNSGVPLEKYSPEAADSLIKCLSATLGETRKTA